MTNQIVEVFQINEILKNNAFKKLYELQVPFFQTKPRILYTKNDKLQFYPCYQLWFDITYAFDICFSLAALTESPIAVKTEKAKTQHYELPTSFFKLVLGKHLKYRQTISICQNLTSSLVPCMPYSYIHHHLDKICCILFPFEVEKMGVCSIFKYL